jgi:putative intracellular protease/amidase
MSAPLIGRRVAILAADGVERVEISSGNLITSRNPDDLPAFCAAIIDALRR